METITVRLHQRTIAELEREAAEHGVSRSGYIRDTLEHRHEHERTRDEYEARIAELETQVERLKNEKRLILEERSERQELVRYVEESRDAGIVQRTKWWLFGRE